jgi:hypothetical protein
MIKRVRRRKIKIMKNRRHLLEAWNFKRSSYWMSIITRGFIMNRNNYVVPKAMSIHDRIANNVSVIKTLFTLYIS